jgi:hypothetical protein
MDYVRLRAAIQEYSEDFEASFVDNVDNFIRLAESRILLRVRLPNFRKDVSGSLAAGDQQIASPSDFLAPDSVAVTEVTVPPVAPRRSILLNKDPEFLRECYPAGDLGLPRFYSMTNEKILSIGPGADAGYTVFMGYFFSPPSIVDAGTTWLGDNFAHALLSGSLVEACTYMKTEDNLYVRYSTAFDKDLAMDEQYAKGRAKKDTYQEPDVRAKV